MGNELMAKLSLYIASLLLSGNFSATTHPHANPTAGPSSAAVLSHSASITSPAASHPAASALASGKAASSDAIAASEQRFVDFTNAERRAKGLKTLTVNALLVQVAREHSREMWEKKYFDHYSPTPGLRTPMERYLKGLGRTPAWAYLGENLFYCSIVDVERGHRCLMDSPKHRENIMNDQFREIGVGCFTAPDGQFYVTQLFLARTG